MAKRTVDLLQWALTSHIGPVQVSGATVWAAQANRGLLLSGLWYAEDGVRCGASEVRCPTPPFSPSPARGNVYFANQPQIVRHRPKVVTHCREPNIASCVCV